MKSSITRRELLAGAAAPSALLGQARRKPNILLVVTDQQRYDTIRALGNEHIDTPNFDALVGAGVTFTHATTPTPVCMSARSSMMTGQWSTTHRCYSNHHPGVEPETHTSNMLRAGGYRSALVGKNHTYLGEDDFDVFLEHPEPLDQAAWGEREACMKENKSKYPRLFDEPVPGGPEGDPMRAVTEQSIRFMDESGERPFFCFASYLHPHTPYHAPEPYFSRCAKRDLPAPVVEPEGLAAAGKPFRQQFHQRNNDAILPFDERRTRLMKQVYYAMVSQVDDEIGRLVKWLGDAGLEENTLVAVTSDHGDYMGDHGLYTKSPAMYDCLVRVPFILRWPGVLEARRNGSFASTVDLMPTLAAAAGVHRPAQAQGMNLLPVARGAQRGRSAAFAEYGLPDQPPYDQARLAAEGIASKLFTNPWNDRLPWEGNPVALAGRFRMIRTHKWKYVQERGGTDEFYNLEEDPNELVNLARDRSQASRLAELRRQLDRWKNGLPGVDRPR